jgi:hypothetical protein
MFKILYINYLNLLINASILLINYVCLHSGIWVVVTANILIYA